MSSGPPDTRVAARLLLAALIGSALPVPALAQAAQSGAAQTDAGEAQELVCTGPAWVRRGTPCEDVLPPTDDQRRTFKKLPANFLRGVVGVFSLENLVPALGGAAATGAASLFDGDPKPPGFESGDLGQLGEPFGNPVGVIAAATSAFAIGRIAQAQLVRDWTYDIFLATTVNFLYTEALKQSVNRTRPDASNNKSFPSGHTSNAFAWATVLSDHYGPIVGVPVYALATLVGFSRIDSGSHYLSDVVAGAVIGVIVGHTITRQNGVPLDGPQFTVMPIVGPSGQRGLGVQIVY